MGTPPEPIPRWPEYRLFDSSAVGLVAFFCGPLAGALLIAVNYARLGKDGKGVLAFILGLTATTLTILTRWHWHNSLGPLASDALVILFIICTWQIAKKVQGNAVEEHIARGGKLGSKVDAFLIGIATLAALFCVVIAARYQPPHK